MMHRIGFSLGAAALFVAHAYAGTSITSATPVRIDGAGPLNVGMTIAEVEKAAGARVTIHNNQEPQGACVIAGLVGAPNEFSFMLIKGTIARFDIYDGVMKTAEGAGIGSTEAEVKRLYANEKIEVERHEYVDGGHYLNITVASAPPGFKFVFETDGRKVTAFRAGRMPEVDWIEGCA